MKRLAAISIILVLLLPLCAEAKVSLFSRALGKRILSGPCLMSYKDLAGRLVVIRANLVEIVLN